MNTILFVLAFIAVSAQNEPYYDEQTVWMEESQCDAYLEKVYQAAARKGDRIHFIAKCQKHEIGQGA